MPSKYTAKEKRDCISSFLDILSRIKKATSFYRYLREEYYSFLGGSEKQKPFESKATLLSGFYWDVIEQGEGAVPSMDLIVTRRKDAREINK